MNKRSKRMCIALFFLVPIVVFLVFFGRKMAIEIIHPLKYQDLIEEYATQNSISPSLICGVIYTESRFRKDAISSANARGLMQITEDTFEWAAWRMGDTTTTYAEVFDPEVNIKFGSYILRLLTDEFESIDVVLAAYNAGWGNVKKWLDDPEYSDNGSDLHTIPFKDTKNYVPNVKAAAQRYQQIYDIP